MGTAIGLVDDFDGASLRRLSRTTKHANQARRLLSLAEIYDGGSRCAASRIGGVGIQIVRDLLLRFNALGPDSLLDGKAPGPRSRLNDSQRQALVGIVERGPIPTILGVLRWRLIDLAQWLHDEFTVSLDETTEPLWQSQAGSGFYGARYSAALHQAQRSRHSAQPELRDPSPTP